MKQSAYEKYRARIREQGLVLQKMGWTLSEIARGLQVPLSEVHDVLYWYSLLSLNMKVSERLRIAMGKRIRATRAKPGTPVFGWL